MTKATVSDEYTEVVGDDEFVEVRGKNFAPTHDFNENPELVGIYNGARTITVDDKPRTIHSFTTDAGDIDAWGAAVLDSRLAGLEGVRVKALKTGQKLSTKSGRKAHEYKVFASKAALNRSAA